MLVVAIQGTAASVHAMNPKQITPTDVDQLIITAVNNNKQRYRVNQQSKLCKLRSESHKTMNSNLFNHNTRSDHYTRSAFTFGAISSQEEGDNMQEHNSIKSPHPSKQDSNHTDILHNEENNVLTNNELEKMHQEQTAEKLYRKDAHKILCNEQQHTLHVDQMIQKRGRVPTKEELKKGAIQYTLFALEKAYIKRFAEICSYDDKELARKALARAQTDYVLHTEQTVMAAIKAAEKTATPKETLTDATRCGCIIL